MKLLLDIADYLKLKNERDYVLFMFGIYSGLRIADILKLRVRDVRDTDYVYIREKKTKKEKKFKLNKDIQVIINRYIETKKNYEYLFPSQQRGKNGEQIPIGRIRAYRILSNAGRKFGIKGNGKIGTHTLRKTFGYWVYKQTGDIIKLQKLFNHASSADTLKYIGITQEDNDMIMDKLSFK